jgi:hypothetical protein
MMKTWIKLYQQPVLLFLLYALLAAALLAPITYDDLIPAMMDYTNHLAAVIEAKFALAEGQFPLRIAPLALSGWRYPYYQFFSPSTYTFAGFIYQYLTPAHPLIAFRLTFWCGLVCGGFFMEKLAYWLVRSRAAAVLASIVYLTAPYYVVVVTGFGNLNETVALGILPVVIYYTLQHYLRPRHTTLLINALAWYLLITIHAVTFFYTALFMGILLFLVTCKNRRHWKNLFACGSAFMFGCLMAMWFLGPVGLLQKYLILAQTFSDTKMFSSLSPSISYLLFPGHMPFQGTMGKHHVSIGCPILLGTVITVYALLNKLRIKNRRANYWLRFFVPLFFIAFFIVWSPINFLRWLPSIFVVGQYSWRLLSQVIWIGSLLFAWSICWLFKNKIDLKQTIIGGLFLVMVGSTAFPLVYINYFNIDIAKFIDHPSAIFNPDAYTIEFNKYTGFVSAIDRMELASLVENQTLKLNKTYLLPRSLLQYADKPFVALRGNLPDDQRPSIVQLKAVLNGTTIAARRLTPGKFYWNIPLGKPIKKNLFLEFKTDKKADIKLEEIDLAGFMSPASVMTVKQVQPFCRQQKTITRCQLYAPPRTKLIELPILYYPKLLSVTLNGQPVSYQGIVYKHSLIAGIVPKPGATNIVNIEFRGLEWANKASWMGWGLWAGLLFLAVKKIILRLHFKQA